MKKFFSAFVIIAAVATAFSCSKIEKVAPVEGEVHTVTFNAVSPATKTTFGTLSGSKYPTYWTANDSKVKVAQNISDGIDATVTKDSDTEASFTADFTDDGSGSYTFYAISPASAVVSGVNKTYFSWNVEIPTTQTSTATGPDESAMILAATSSTVGTFPTDVDLSFKHVTAYAKMSITNLDLAAGDEVASVLITADANIANRFYYYVSGAKVGTLEEHAGSGTSITVLTTSASDIWFACAPMASGTELTISVTTKNSKVYTKVVNTPAALAAGHVASFSVDFAGIVPPSDKVYNLVTSYAELTAGSKVIIAAVGDSDYAAGIGTTSDDYILAVSQAKSADDSKITNPAATVDIFTVEAGGSANTIALHGTNGYLYAKGGGNNMGIQTSNDVNGYWTPTIMDALTGEMSLVATGSSNNNHMRYNNGASRFSCYKSTSSVTDLQALYKLEGSGSGSSLISTYTVTYDGNGNTAGSAPAAFETPGPFKVAAAGSLEKSGYTFNGWNTAANGSGTPYAAGADAVATADVTLYAQWAAAGGSATLQYTLDGTETGGTNGYATASEITQNGITWQATGNTTTNPWRIGGKNLTNENRAIYSTTAISSNISSIEVESGTATVTVNSLTITVHNSSADAASGANAIATKTVTTGITSSTVTLTKADETSWANKYYRIVYNVTAGGSNQYVQFVSAKFYGN